MFVLFFSLEEFDFLNRVIFKPGNLQQTRLVVHGKPGESEREVIFVVTVMSIIIVAFIIITLVCIVRFPMFGDETWEKTPQHAVLSLEHHPGVEDHHNGHQNFGHKDQPEDHHKRHQDVGHENQHRDQPEDYHQDQYEDQHGDKKKITLRISMKISMRITMT